MSNVDVDRFEEAVAKGECFQVRVDGLSMLPLLGYGRDTLIVRRIGLNEPIVGRIVMCRIAPKHYVTHRAIEVENGMVTMLGDGRLTYDHPISRECVVGVVEGVIRQSGKRVSCMSRSWRLRERLWLAQPMLLRRLSLALIRRWRNLTHKRLTINE